MKNLTVFASLVLGSLGLACDSTALVGAQNPPQDDGPVTPTGTDASGPIAPTGGDAGAPASDAPGSGVLPGSDAGGPSVMGDGAGGPVPWLFFDSLRSLNRDIYAVRADGTSLRRLTTSPAVEREPAISPDGTMLAFSSDTDGAFQLYVMPLPSGALRQVTHRAGGAEQPAWSPDGRTLAFRSGPEIVMVDADGTNVRSFAVGYATYNGGTHPSFTPDGRSIVYERSGLTYRYELAAQEETSVASGEHPTISSDGATIAYGDSCDQGDLPAGRKAVSTIWLAPLAASTSSCRGTPVTTVAVGNARSPALGPTGRIAFEHGFGPARLGLVSLGGAVEDVTSGGDDRNPTWAPVSLVLP